MIRKLFLYLFMLISVVILQLTVAPYIAIFGIKPNFFISFVVLIALLKGSGAGMVAGIVLGTVWDNYSVTGFGMYMFLMSLLGLLVGVFKKHAFRENYFVSCVVVFVATFAYESVTYIVTVLSHFFDVGFVAFMGYIWNALIKVILFEALYNLVGIVFLQFAFGKIIMRLGERDDGFGGELTWQK